VSKLAQFSRPFETFDPANKRHRKIFHEVLKYRTWGRSPICFWNEDDASGMNSLMDQCTKSMGRYYIVKEFGNLIDNDPFLPTDDIRTRVNPHPHQYESKTGVQ
jgi:hypothetical protein